MCEQIVALIDFVFSTSVDRQGKAYLALEKQTTLAGQGTPMPDPPATMAAVAVRRSCHCAVPLLTNLLVHRQDKVPSDKATMCMGS